MSSEGKYVPPSLRKKMEQQQARDAAREAAREAAPAPQPQKQAPRGSDALFESFQKRDRERTERTDRNADRSSSHRGAWVPGSSKPAEPAQGATGGRYIPAPAARQSFGGSRYGRGARDWALEPPHETELFKGSLNTEAINYEVYDSIPVDVSGSPAMVAKLPDPIQTFQELKVPECLARNIERAGYTRPTPIQKHAVTAGMEGLDVMASAQTGSGKTAAFILPVVARMMMQEQAPRPTSKAHPLAIILTPTRELAQQVVKNCWMFVHRCPVTACVVYGGADSSSQSRVLRRTPPDVLVATPGRLIDFIEQGIVSVESVKWLVLDEADRMLEMGFEEQIRSIVDLYGMPRHATDGVGRQTLMFSATFPVRIQRMARDYLADYIYITVGEVGSTTSNIKQTVMYVPDHQKRQKVQELLSEADSKHLTLIFVETKRGCAELARYLRDEGCSCTVIHGDMPQSERQMALRHFATGRYPILVATDVAQRGLDIDNVTHVINFDLPKEISNYTHRIGRTGRVGHQGFATSFVNESSRSRSILRPLLTKLQETGQEVPDWFRDLVNRLSRGPGGRGGGRGRAGDARRGNRSRSFRHGGGGDRFGGGGRHGGSSYESAPVSRERSPSPQGDLFSGWGDDW